MKKYIALVLATVTIITLSAFVPTWVENSLTEVTVITVKKGSYTETVTANGSVDYRDKVEIKTEIPFIPDEVHVEVGDAVSVGDALVTVNKEETYSAVMSLLNISGVNFSNDVLEVFSDQADKLLDWSEFLPNRIFSTASGIVTGVQIVKGEMVMPDTAIITISDTKKLQAKVAVSEAFASKIKAGQRVTITGTALKNRKYSGRVIKVFPTARKQYSGTTQQTVVDTLIQLDRADTDLKAGYSVKAEIVVNEKRSFSGLPYEAVGQDETGEYVCLYQAGKVQKKYIETGVELAEMIEVTSGIEAEDCILKHPESLRENQFVRIVGTE